MANSIDVLAQALTARVGVIRKALEAVDVFDFASAVAIVQDEATNALHGSDGVRLTQTPTPLENAIDARERDVTGALRGVQASALSSRAIVAKEITARLATLSRGWGDTASEREGV